MKETTWEELIATLDIKIQLLDEYTASECFGGLHKPHYNLNTLWNHCIGEARYTQWPGIMLEAEQAKLNFTCVASVLFSLWVIYRLKLFPWDLTMYCGCLSSYSEKHTCWITCKGRWHAYEHQGNKEKTAQGQAFSLPRYLKIEVICTLRKVQGFRTCLKSLTHVSSWCYR